MVKDLAYEFMRWREQIGKEGGLLGWAGLGWVGCPINEDLGNKATISKPVDS